MADFTFTIHGPSPALNATYKVVTIAGRGRLAKHSDVAAWQGTAALIARLARPKGWTPARRVRITVEWWTPRAKDGDAGIKALQDAIAHGLGCDDRGFLITVRSNEVDKVDPRTVVEITNEP